MMMLFGLGFWALVLFGLGFLIVTALASKGRR
jgi:hypothetical protein